LSSSNSLNCRSNTTRAEKEEARNRNSIAQRFSPDPSENREEKKEEERKGAKRRERRRHRTARSTFGRSCLLINRRASMLSTRNGARLVENGDDLTERDRRGEGRVRSCGTRGKRRAAAVRETSESRLLPGRPFVPNVNPQWRPRPVKGPDNGGLVVEKGEGGGGSPRRDFSVSGGTRAELGRSSREKGPVTSTRALRMMTCVYHGERVYHAARCCYLRRSEFLFLLSQRPRGRGREEPRPAFLLSSTRRARADGQTDGRTHV